MNTNIFQADLIEVKNFLLTRLSEVLITDKYADLKYSLDELKDKQQPSAIYLAFSKVVRLFGKTAINYKPGHFEQADIIRKNWSPPSSVDKAIRLLILLEMPHDKPDIYISTLENLFDAADVGEQVALFTAFPVLPYPENLIKRCEEGIRSNMGEVFEAIANDNPFPADYLSEDAFNQMVLKCLFVGKPLFKIVNLSHRLNSILARMASDYAHERFAAMRKVNPELWQLIAPYLQLEDMKDVERLIWTGDEFDRQAATLLCSVSDIKEAKDFLANSNYKSAVESGDLNWFNLGAEVWKASILSAI